VKIPHDPETSNVILFELILLQSEVVPKDYCVGWGVFPLLDSEFELNQGKFKVPLMFGFLNNKFDKFKKLESAMQNDLDKWLCNTYFEIQKCNLADIQYATVTKELYHKRVDLDKVDIGNNNIDNV